MSTQLVSFDIDTIALGQPLPFSLKNVDGKLLAQKGFVIHSRQELDKMVGHGFSFYIDVSDSQAHNRAYVNKLHQLVLHDTTLGEIADARPFASDLQNKREEVDAGPLNWLDLQVQANAILRDSASPTFLKRLHWLDHQLHRHIQTNPDGALFALIYLSASQPHHYSATHAMLINVMCRLTAHGVLGWQPEFVQTLSFAALTMNLGMVGLQDKLSLQLAPPTSDQRHQIQTHSDRSVELLENSGVSETTWLEAVACHHTAASGTLANKTLGQRMARLIQRADTFSARLASRASRAPETQAAAIQSSYFDERRNVDEAGAALIKAVGVYSPSVYVRLATQEVAVVIRRGNNTATPRVAVVLNREGIATVEPIIRDTGLREYRIISGVAHRDVRVQLNLQRMLGLTASLASDWP